LVKSAVRRQLELLAIKRSFCRFHVGAVEPHVYWYCPVLVVASQLVPVLERGEHWGSCH
jgi:hypothetical protein